MGAADGPVVVAAADGIVDAAGAVDGLAVEADGIAGDAGDRAGDGTRKPLPRIHADFHGSKLRTEATTSVVAFLLERGGLPGFQAWSNRQVGGNSLIPRYFIGSIRFFCFSSQRFRSLVRHIAVLRRSRFRRRWPLALHCRVRPLRRRSGHRGWWRRRIIHFFVHARLRSGSVSRRRSLRTRTQNHSVQSPRIACRTQNQKIKLRSVQQVR